MPIDRKELPDDPDILARMVIDMARQMDRMQGQIDYLTRQLFGRKSEKINLDSTQGRLYTDEASGDVSGEASADPDPAASSTGQDPRSTPEKKKRPGEERRSLPRNLPRVERHHVLDSLTPCAHCGKTPAQIGEGKSAETLAYVPSSFHVIKDTQYTYACGCGETIVTSAAPMRPIVGGLPDAGLLANVVASKYADHVPLHRQEGILQRQGIEIGRSVLCGWVKHCYELLLPLYVAMKAALLQLDYIGLDATFVKVVEKGRGRARKGTMWAYRSARDSSLVVFEYTPTHNKDGPLEFLKGFKGFIQADAHPHHDPLFKDQPERKEVGCWSHARRPFERIAVKAKRKSGVHARVALTYIKQLFDIEKEAVERGLSPDDRLKLRQQKSAPVMENLRKWIDETLKVSLPRTDFGRAVQYLDTHWKALSRFLEDGRLEVHNNFVEQEIRKIALGRNNWIQFGNENGARWGTVMFSLVASCRRGGVDPFLYFYDVLERISSHPASRVRELLPDQWKVLFEAEAKAKIEKAREALRGATVDPSGDAESAATQVC